MIAIREEYPLLEMANMRGVKVKTDRIEFSFYFSDKSGYTGDLCHSIRVKIIWNPEKMQEGDADGYMELFGDYRYVNSKGKPMPNPQEINQARGFFKKYKVLFAAVWEKKLQADVVQDYFRCAADLEDVCRELGIAQKITNLSELEKYVREHRLYSMND